MSPKKVIFVQRLIPKTTFLLQGYGKEPHTSHSYGFHATMFLFLHFEVLSIYILHEDCVSSSKVFLHGTIYKFPSNPFLNYMSIPSWCGHRERLFSRNFLKIIVTWDLIILRACNTVVKTTFCFFFFSQLKINNILAVKELEPQK